MRTRLIGAALSLAGSLLLLGPTSLHGCDGGVVIHNQYLFRDAALIYEGVARGTPFAFYIERTWRGAERDRVELTWPAGQVDDCTTGQRPTRPGERYLILINCSEPSHGDVFTCQARTLDIHSSLLLYLTDGEPLGAEDVAQVLRGWLADEISTSSLAQWAARMRLVAQVDDWSDDRDDPDSLTLTVVDEIHLLFNQDALSELQCEIDVFREHIAPFLIPILESQKDWPGKIDQVAKLFVNTDSFCF